MSRSSAAGFGGGSPNNAQRQLTLTNDFGVREPESRGVDGDEVVAARQLGPARIFRRVQGELMKGLQEGLLKPLRAKLSEAQEGLEGLEGTDLSALASGVEGAIEEALRITDVWTAPEVLRRIDYWVDGLGEYE
jgi:hypothetical protein